MLFFIYFLPRLLSRSACVMEQRDNAPEQLWPGAKRPADEALGFSFTATNTTSSSSSSLLRQEPGASWKRQRGLEEAHILQPEPSFSSPSQPGAFAVLPPPPVNGWSGGLEAPGPASLTYFHGLGGDAVFDMGDANVPELPWMSDVDMAGHIDTGEASLPPLPWMLDVDMADQIDWNGSLFDNGGFPREESDVGFGLLGPGTESGLGDTVSVDLGASMLGDWRSVGGDGDVATPTPSPLPRSREESSALDATPDTCFGLVSGE